MYNAKKKKKIQEILSLHIGTKQSKRYNTQTPDDDDFFSFFRDRSHEQKDLMMCDN